jgi:hypothetical protein
MSSQSPNSNILWKEWAFFLLKCLLFFGALVSVLGYFPVNQWFTDVARTEEIKQYWIDFLRPVWTNISSTLLSAFIVYWLFRGGKDLDEKSQVQREEMISSQLASLSSVAATISDNVKASLTCTSALQKILDDNLAKLERQRAKLDKDKSDLIKRLMIMVEGNNKLPVTNILSEEDGIGDMVEPPRGIQLAMSSKSQITNKK